MPRLWLQRWPDTPQIIAKMFNDSLGITQIKSTPTDYNEEIIPNLPNGNFPNWFAWTSLVSSPDPRSGLRSTFLSTSSANFNKVNNPQLDSLIDEALTAVDLDRARNPVREVQKVLIESGQYGTVNLYNYITRSVSWNYWKPSHKQQPSSGKPAIGWALDAGHRTPVAWIDSKDQSYQGRPPATV